MSFLPALDDERETLATLEDALAFIDSCEQQQEGDALAVGHIPKFGRWNSTQCRSRDGSSTKKVAHRERVKAELQQLRQEAAALEICLVGLKLRHAFHNVAASNAVVKHSSRPQSLHRSELSAKWIEIVVREYQRRKQSETANRKLKALLIRLLKAAKSPEQALATQLSQEDKMLMCRPSYDTPMPVKMFQNKIPVVESLVDRLDHLVANLEILFANAGLEDEASCIFHTKRRSDKAMGQVFESASSTPLSSDTTETDCLFQKYHNNGTCNMDDPSLMTYTSTFPSEGLLHPMRGIMRKHIEADRIVYVWTSVTSLLNKGFSLKEEGIIKICRPRVASLGSQAVGSQLQTWYSAYTVPHAPSSTGNETSCAAEKLLLAHSKKMSIFLQKFTEDLQDETKGEICERADAMCAVY